MPCRIPERNLAQHSQHTLNRLAGGEMTGQTTSTLQTAPGDQVNVENQNAPESAAKKARAPCLPKKPKKSTKTPN